MTALFPARSEDFAAVLRGHPFEEAVHALATAVMRLKCPLHETTPWGENKSMSL
jgi:hypothetical protein